MTVDAVESRGTVLVGPGELRDLLASGAEVTVLDVRWALGRTDGREQHAAGHVPGAVYVDLDTELAAPASAKDGRHPLPAVADLQTSARRWGVRGGGVGGVRGVPVVVYDAGGGMAAARAWWLLRWGGVNDVRLLDGGLEAWRAAGGALERGAVQPVAGNVVLTPGAMPAVDADGIALLADVRGAEARAAGIVLDARASERYRGEVEPIDPRAGHIPGAICAPTAANLDADGRFLPAEVLRERFAAVGIEAGAQGRTVAVYCGSGVTAAHEIAALASLGVEAALYAGSWSQWSADPRREVAVGAD
jgi:thiosulfate/3-mercaptopyruvate sulfurtransferase